MNSLREIASELRKPGKTLLTSHILPDGDSIGSLLGLGLAMRKAGYDTVMFSVDKVPDRYRFLRGTELIITHALPDVDYRRAVALDCSDHLRILPVWEKVRGSLVINIDHHPTNEMFGRMNFVDTTAAATGEIVFDLLEELEIPVDNDIAAPLYVAISTDTGSFKYENTTPRTHHVASLLLEAGVNPRDITPTVFDMRTRAASFILRDALVSLTFSDDGRVAWMILTEEEMAGSGARDEDLEGVVNFAKNIEGVEVGMIFRAKEDGTVKVGFRSHNIDVGRVAKELGGGGHARAAGCSLQADLDSALSEVLSAVEKALRGDGEGHDGRHT